jgi:hypothetical protein
MEGSGGWLLTIFEVTVGLKLRKVTLENGIVIGAGRPPEPGEWWYAPQFWNPDKPESENFIIRGAKRFSEGYWHTWADRRPPIFLVLPDGTHWSPDMAYPVGTGIETWEVTGPWEPGEEPRWTVTPSIQTPGYHGHLTHGELTDDLEGRSYGEAAPV